MVIQGHVAQQCLLQTLAAAEPVGLQNIGNTAIETLDHTIGSECPGLGQSVLYAEHLAQLVKLMLAAGLTLAGCIPAVASRSASTASLIVRCTGTCCAWCTPCTTSSGTKMIVDF